MKIKIDRDSVAVGDDIDNHSICFLMENNATYEELFQILKEKSYFPCIAGNNVVWALLGNEGEYIFTYFTKNDKCFVRIKNINGQTLEGYLKYYSSPNDWKETMESLYQNNKNQMKKDGWQEELKYCEELMEK